MGFERFANSRGGFIFLNCECTTPNKPFADKYFLDNNLSILLLVYLKHPQDTKKVCESNYLQSCTSVLFKCWRELLALIHSDQSKTKRAIPVPLNSLAQDIVAKQKGKHPIYVFTYQGEPVSRCNNHAWRKALIRARIKDFRWHDLRHTWASWHVQSGTSLHELQQLGGWSDYDTVLRYAHLSSDHLQKAAERVSGTFSPLVLGS